MSQVMSYPIPAVTGEHTVYMPTNAEVIDTGENFGTPCIFAECRAEDIVESTGRRFRVAMCGTYMGDKEHRYVGAVYWDRVPYLVFEVTS